MIRIVGGEWRGRRLRTPPGEATRPAMEAHRGTLMNILGPDLSGVRMLDVFAGSGAFGLECLSRGAASATFVERARPAVATIRANVEDLGPPPGAAHVVAADAYRLPPLEGAFDVVFVAPPYPHFRTERPRLLALLESLPQRLAPGGTVVVQSDAGDFDGTVVAGLETYDRRRMGRTDFTFLRAV